VDYPIQPKRCAEVTITDSFWKSKIATNAQVTIPLEVQKLAATPRGFIGNVLEAAILSLTTHPNPALHAQVEARIRAIASAPPGGAHDGTSGFEVAATYYHATGKRDLVEKAIASAEALYEDFRRRNPPFSGGERDAINCVQLYRVTHDRRWERASLECCPPNLVRFLASMPSFIYAQDRSGAISVNLYVSSDTSFTVDSKKIALSVQSELPWAGKSAITVSTTADVKAILKLRIPGWARNRPAPGGLYTYLDPIDAPPAVAVNGQRVSAAPDRTGYVSLDRLWKNGEVVSVDFPVNVRRVVADPRVAHTRRRMAVERGPVVYCSEWPEADGGRVLTLLFDSASTLKPSVDADRKGVTVIHAEARSITNPSSQRKPVTLVPYYLWANRGAGEMTVWLSTAGYSIGDVGPAGGFIFHENPNHAADGWRYLEAAPFDQSAGAQWGCFRRAVAGARGTAIGTGQQNTLDMIAACAEAGTASQLCAALSVNGVRGWYLPSRDELALLYRHLKAAGIGDFLDGGAADNFTYWASSQQTADMAIHIDFADLGRQHGDDKDFPRRVRAIRTIE
jgi:DUF1680 family protein